MFLFIIPYLLSRLIKLQIEFINENIAKRGVSFAEWSSMFKTACDNEVGMFETGKQAPTPFQIIPDGDYFIHIPDSKMVVLAVRNVKELSRGSLDKRLRGYFSDNAGPLSVVGVRKRGDNDKVIEMYCSLLFFELIDYIIVACCCDQRWIYVPKFGDTPISWDKFQ